MSVLMVVIWCVAVAAMLCLLLIMPRIAGKPDDGPIRKVLYAHRGLHNNEPDADGVIVPENSMAAFRKAVEGGYGIELDVQLSKDKIPIVFHDATLDRMCEKTFQRKVCDFTFEELQRFSLCGSPEKIPSLADVLELVGGKVPLIVEYKADFTDISVCPISDKLLQGYKGIYCVESFNPLAVLWYRRNRREVIRGQLSDYFLKEAEYNKPLYFFLQNLVFNWLTKPDFIAYNHKYPDVLPRVICRRLFRNLAVAWTIKSEEELAEAKKHFDAFIFDSFLPAQSCMGQGAEGQTERDK